MTEPASVSRTDLVTEGSGLGSSPDASFEAVPPPVEEFSGRITVRYAEFLERLREIAAELEHSPLMEAAYRELLSAEGLSEAQLPMRSFSRARMIFEATRDGGLWGVRWQVTNRMPWSDFIWQTWDSKVQEGQLLRQDTTTAVAECDELSALFSFLTRDLGVVGTVGLFYPTWNHTVAVWEIPPDKSLATSKSVRLIVPTSQIWLSRGASLGTHEFRANRVVYGYPRADLGVARELRAELARFLVEQVKRLAPMNESELISRRTQLGGS